MTAPCTYCSKQVDPESIWTLEQITGYEKKAQGGSRRGGSDIVLRKRTGHFACHECVERLKRGVAPMQGTLGGEAA